jgi:hypothetical protein
MRGRNRSSGGGGNGGGGGGGGGNGGGRGPNPLTRSYESNGPDVKIRGTAGTIADKYVQLSRDALTSGDPVAAENYLQHAEHYYRMLAVAQAQYQPNQTFVRADSEDYNHGDDDEESGEGSNTEPAGQPLQGGAGAPENNGQQRFNGDRNRQNNPGQNGQGGQNGQQNGQGGERRFDRNERRDRPERDRSENRGERQPERGERTDRGERQPRADRSVEEQPFVGDLPSFITKEQPVRAEPVPARPAPAPEPVVVAAPETPPVAAEAGDDEQGEGRVAPRSRRRRYGRARTGEGEAAGAEPEIAPEGAAD